MNFPSMRVDGKIALVTGAGSGLGQAFAIALAQNGADVIITELPGKESIAEETASQIRDAGRRAMIVPLDVTRVSMIRETVDRVVKDWGRVDILVNNAGINIPRWAVDVSEDDWDKVLDVDLKGTFFMCQAVAKASMIPQNYGKIINIASIMGVTGFYYRAAYCSAKAGVVNLSRVLAVEWATHKIRVNAIGPTFIHTPLTAPMFADKNFYDEVMRRMPLGEIGKPEDVVGAVLYLACPASDLVTGHCLLVDGGWMAW
ncbi:MAG: glucose 1-dehydrogenase [Chloroflexi bacterium]|nr:glucose 1-dehydrogenase [Chloroflexota bacterium]